MLVTATSLGARGRGQEADDEAAPAVADLCSVARQRTETALGTSMWPSRLLAETPAHCGASYLQQLPALLG